LIIHDDIPPLEFDRLGMLFLNPPKVYMKKYSLSMKVISTMKCKIYIIIEIICRYIVLFRDKMYGTLGFFLE